MKKLSTLAAIAFASIATATCMNTGNTVGIGPAGLIFTKTQIGLSGQPGGTKSGKACAYRITPLFAFGNGSTEDAARDGQITVIKSVGRDNLDVLNLFTMACTVVQGTDGQAPGPSSTGVSGFSDTVILKNGASYTNCKAAVTGDSVVVTTSDGKTIVLSKADVQTVQKK